MEEAVIVQWLKAPGDSFTRGEPLVEVETDKATIVYEAEADGVIAAILVAEGSSARLGETIATLVGDGATPTPTAATAPTPAAAPAATPVVSPAAPATAPAPDDGGRVRASPVARRRAAELGVSLHGLVGTGPGGQVTADDVERAAAAGGSAPTVAATPTASGRDRGTVESTPLTPTRATIARRMALSTSTVPAFTVTMEIDMSAVVGMRRSAEKPAPSINDFVVRAVALTLRRFPAFNSAWLDDRIERYGRVNVGIAVALDDALLVPTLFDADTKPLAEIATESRSLAERAKSRSLAPDEITQSTFTVSNLGMFGVHSFTAIVDVPQAAILAVAAIARRPREAADGTVVFRDTMLATLVADHRIVYGADSAAFLAHLKQLLEDPQTLLA